MHDFYVILLKLKLQRFHQISYNLLLYYSNIKNTVRFITTSVMFQTQRIC